MYIYVYMDVYIYTCVCMRGCPVCLSMCSFISCIYITISSISSPKKRTHHHFVVLIALAFLAIQDPATDASKELVEEVFRAQIHKKDGLKGTNEPWRMGWQKC